MMRHGISNVGGAGGGILMAQPPLPQALVGRIADPAE